MGYVSLPSPSIDPMPVVNTQSAVELGLQFHGIMMEKIAAGGPPNLTSRHQPHNNKPPSQDALRQSIINLIQITDAIMCVSPKQHHKEFYHSKSIAIMTGQPSNGGCYGAGALTGQSLLHVLSCLGLIPIDLAYWGEIAVNPSFLESLGITKENGKADQFLTTLASHLEISLADAEHVSCKYGRKQRGTDGKYRDVIFHGQSVYCIGGDGKLHVYDGKKASSIDCPANNFPGNTDLIVAPTEFWWTPTTRRVRGRNRLPKKATRKEMMDPTQEEVHLSLPTTNKLFLGYTKTIIKISINDMLGHALADKPLPWKSLLAHYKRYNTDSGTVRNWQFAYKTRTGAIVTPVLERRIYQCPIECKIDGVLRYVAETNCAVLSKWVFCLVESKKVKKQIDDSNKDSEDYVCGMKRKKKGKQEIWPGYHVLHFAKWNDRRPARPIAIAYYLSCNRLLFACLNERYYTEKKDYYILHRV